MTHQDISSVDPPPERVEWRTASLAVAVIAITILPATLTGALAISVGEETGLRLIGVGGLYGVLFGVSAITSTATGRLVQRIGWRAGIRLSAGGTGAALLALAVAPSDWWEVWWPIAMFFGLAGITAAGSQTASNQAMVHSVPPGRYGLMFGLKHTAVPAAAMAGGLAVPTIALTIGWRYAYGAAALAALATVLAVPRGVHRPFGTAPATGRAKPATPLAVLVGLAAAAALGHAGLDSLGAFVVPYAVSEGVTEGLAGLLLTLGSVAGLTMRLLSGWLVDRRQHTGLIWMASLLAVGSLGFLGLTIGGTILLVIATVVAFAGGWGWAGLLTFIVVRANPDTAAVATGIANTGKYVGAGGGPLLFGFLADRVSFATAWATATGLLMAAAAIVVVVRMTAAGKAMADPPTKPSS